MKNIPISFECLSNCRNYADRTKFSISRTTTNKFKNTHIIAGNVASQTDVVRPVFYQFFMKIYFILAIFNFYPMTIVKATEYNKLKEPKCFDNVFFTNHAIFHKNTTHH